MSMGGKCCWTRVCALLLLSAATQVSAASSSSHYCYAEDNNPYRFFGTKTSYEVVGREDTGPLYFPGCRPVQFWFVSREGSSFPDDDETQEMKTDLYSLRDTITRNHDSRRGELCREDQDVLRHWRLQVDQTYDNLLSPAGIAELKELGRRYRMRLPTLLSSSFGWQYYEFRHSPAKRSEQSAKAFAQGLFDSREPLMSLPRPMDHDPNQVDSRPYTVPSTVHLQYYEDCRRWNKAVKDSNMNEEIEGFTDSWDMQVTVAKISRRLGFRGNLSLDILSLMYDSCGYEKALKPDEPSPWCTAFTKEDLRMFEFKEDLEAYYKYGYGTDFNYYMGCPLIKDMMSRFRSMQRRGDAGPFGVFYFGHAPIVQLLLTSLGIARDKSDLRYNSWNSDRRWSNSRMVPFAGNLAAVMLNCTSDFKVQFYLQEKPADICQAGLCTWHEMERLFRDLAHECDESELCDAASSIALAPLLLLLSLLPYLFPR